MRVFHQESKMLFRRLFQIKQHNFSPELSSLGCRFTHQMTELNETPCEYPPIIGMSEESQNKSRREQWYDSIKALPSVEEKLFELAAQQKLDLKKYSITSVPPTLNGINFYNYITRTHTISDLPKIFLNMNVDSELNQIRNVLCETLLNYYSCVWERNKLKKLSDFLVEPNAGSKLASSLILQCFKKLSVRNDYIFNSTIQQKPRIFSFWWHGGFDKDEAEVDERNLCFQYEDHGTFAIRGKDPLLPIVGMKDDLSSAAEVIDYNFHPDVFQFPSKTKPQLASIPGFWPGDPHEYPFLLVLTSDRFQSLTSQLEFYDDTKVANGAAVISSFAWLNAIASYQGFTPFHDLTYPLVTYTIVTNGQNWNFYVYQLNTIAFHDDVDKKDRRNLCWSSGKLRLFETVEDGQVKGINEEVFSLLLKFLHNTPQVRDDIDLKPYLGTDTRSRDEIVNMRILQRKSYSRVPGHVDHRDEIPTWVKIYKLHPDAPPSPHIRME